MDETWALCITRQNYRLQISEWYPDLQLVLSGVDLHIGKTRPMTGFDFLTSLFLPIFFHTELYIVTYSMMLCPGLIAL
jgi:hypothetical protein